MKKINLSIVLTFVFAVVLAFTSCKEVCDVIPVETETETKLDNDDAKNEKNEFDDYGEIHNKTLDFLGEKFGGKLLTTPMKEIQIALNDFAKSMGHDELKEDDFVVVEQALKCVEDGGIIDGGCIRDPFCVLFPRKCDFFDRLMKPWTYKTIESQDEVRSFIQSCRDFEDEIIVDEKLTPRERGFGLRAISIARYSTVYWQNQNSDPTGSVWSGELQSAKSICWSCVIAGDALGGIGGPFTAGLVSGILLANQSE